jgi:amidase
MKTHDLLTLSASDLARAIRDRRLSSEEVVGAYLRRIAEINPVLNTVIQIAPESALEQARAADEALARGQNWGPLHGVPFTVKDVYSLGEGVRLVTAPGMPSPLHDAAAERDTVAVGRLRAAGAIPLAVTRATLWSDRDERYGYARNPYGLLHTVSGSSGGEAATIAAGGSPLGMGSDSGGSLRMPAHFCGIATLRPSNGRVPRASDAAGTNDPRTVAGPMARSIDDVALAMQIVQGFDWEDPTTTPVPWSDYKQVDLNGRRVALFTDNGIVTPTAATVAAVNAAASALTAAGAIVTEVTPPGMAEAWEITLDYWRYCGEVGAVADYFRFLERWDRYRLSVNAFMRHFDLIVCPVEAYPAPLQDGQQEGIPGFTYTAPFSLVGWPCGVVRAGTTSETLPVSVQVVGQPWRDDVVLAACRHIETVCGGWQSPPALP